jgi:hypothetical protein
VDVKLVSYTTGNRSIGQNKDSALIYFKNQVDSSNEFVSVLGFDGSTDKADNCVYKEFNW